jgi:hypothetical protein
MQISEEAFLFTRKVKRAFVLVQFRAGFPQGFLTTFLPEIVSARKCPFHLKEKRLLAGLLYCDLMIRHAHSPHHHLLMA